MPHGTTLSGLKQAKRLAYHDACKHIREIWVLIKRSSTVAENFLMDLSNYV